MIKASKLLKLSRSESDIRYHIVTDQTTCNICLSGKFVWLSQSESDIRYNIALSQITTPAIYICQVIP